MCDVLLLLPTIHWPNVNLVHMIAGLAHAERLFFVNKRKNNIIYDFATYSFLSKQILHASFFNVNKSTIKQSIR